MLTGDDDEEAACRNLLADGIPIVALKRGDEGSRVYTDSQVIEVSTIQVTEID